MEAKEAQKKQSYLAKVRDAKLRESDLGWMNGIRCCCGVWD